MTLQPKLPANPQPQWHTILLVEDEPFVRDATASILQRAGHEVLTAEDATEALQVYEQCHGNIDLLITDMVLPGKTGKQLGDDLRQQSLDLAVLITSGYSNQECDIERPEARTFFLAKPYSRRALLEKVEKILEAAPLSRAATQAG